MYDMALWEFNACVRAYNRKHQAEEEAAIVHIWQTANMTGAAFAGKLKPLSHFTGEKTVMAPKVTPAQMAAMDKRFAERREANGP